MRGRDGPGAPGARRPVRIEDAIAEIGPCFGGGLDQQDLVGTNPEVAIGQGAAEMRRGRWRTSSRSVPRADLDVDVTDPGADFVDLTIAKLGLRGQRREVAEATDVPMGTVKSRLARGRSELQRSLWSHARDAGIVEPSQPSGDRRAL